MTDTYRRRPLTVTARQVAGCDTGEAARELAAWCGGDVAGAWDEPAVYVDTPGGQRRARTGAWIVRLPDGAHEVVSAAEFARYYMPVPDRLHWVPPHGRPIVDRGGAT